MLLLGDKIDFANALNYCDHRGVLAGLEKGADVNTKGTLNVMDLFMVKNCTAGIEMVLNNPKWNPNYLGHDGLSLIERALIKGKESFALRVMKHPNFDPKARLGGGRTLAMAAVMFSAPRVFKATKDMTLPTEIDSMGKTLAQYLAEFGHPRTGKIKAIQRKNEAYRQRMMVKGDYTRV